MAEEVVSKDQFTEFVKRMEQGFHHADQRHNDLLVMINQRFDQVNQRFEQMDWQWQEDWQAMLQQFQQVDQRMSQHESRLMSMENWIRTTFVTVALVAFGVAAQLFYTFLRLA